MISHSWFGFQFFETRPWLDLQQLGHLRTPCFGPSWKDFDLLKLSCLASSTQQLRCSSYEYSHQPFCLFWWCSWNWLMGTFTGNPAIWGSKTSRRVRNRACRRINMLKKMITLSVFRGLLIRKKMFPKKVIFLGFCNPYSTNFGPFFALPLSLIIVHVDLCGFFHEVRTQSVFPTPLPGSNVLIDLGIETITRFCTDWGRHCCLTQLPSWVNATPPHAQRSMRGVFNFNRTFTSPPHHMLSVACVACSTSTERSHLHPNTCSA